MLKSPPWPSRPYKIWLLPTSLALSLTNPHLTLGPRHGGFFLAFCWSMMVLSLCLGIFAPVPLLRTLFPQLFGLPCSLTSFGAYLAPRYLVMEDFPDRYPQLVPLRSSLHHAACCLLLYDT